MGSQKEYLGHLGRCASFVTSFKSILKLVECFTSYGELEKIFRTLRKSASFVTSFKIIPKACRMFHRKNIWDTQEGVQSL